jgi:hypothetical protein
MIKACAIVAVAAFTVASLFGAIGSPIEVDTTQPAHTLDRLEAWQGYRLSLRVTVKEGSLLYTNAGSSVTVQYGTNLSAIAGTMTGGLTNGLALLTSDLLAITGRCEYVLSVASGDVTNTLGSGVLNVTEIGALPN